MHLLSSGSAFVYSNVSGRFGKDFSPNFRTRVPRERLLGRRPTSNTRETGPIAPSNFPLARSGERCILGLLSLISPMNPRVEPNGQMLFARELAARGGRVSFKDAWKQ
jgi:hypothetical protein